MFKFKEIVHISLIKTDRQTDRQTDRVTWCFTPRERETQDFWLEM